ncbi:MAG: hydroxypyruvate isomerase family protein [Acidimicrobiales bacterium]
MTSPFPTADGPADTTVPTRLSANLGLLWTDLALPDAIEAAAAAGFDAVECHFPYAVDPADVRAALAATGLPLLALNTRPGDPAAGESGLAALPGREADARALIDQAVAYAAAVGCANVHVMAGTATGPEARAAYVANLAHAARSGADAGVGILIEPINQRDIPGYHLSHVETAAVVVAAVADTAAVDNVRIMFDCYHVQITQGDLLRRFTDHVHLVGHVQFAAVPSRAEPDGGEVDYAWLLPRFTLAGYGGAAGAEYRPATTTAAGLGWLAAFGR